MAGTQRQLIGLLSLVLVSFVFADEQKLDPSNGEEGDRFGWSVATSGDYAVIGAPYAEVDGNVNKGAAYVFHRSGDTWSQQAELAASDDDPGEYFGTSVGISGEYIIVGAPQEWSTGTGAGAAYIFKRSGSSWTEQAKIVPIDTWRAYDEFGTSVSISSIAGSEYAAIGAPYDDEHGEDSGSLYIFHRTAGDTWVQEAELFNEYSASEDHFGHSVFISSLGTVVIAGAPGDDIGSNEDQGSARVFMRDGSSWNPTATLTASEGTSYDEFGSAVAVSGIGADIIVGAQKDPGNGSGCGAAYVYHYDGDWIQQARLFPTGGDGWDWFGRSVAINGIGDRVVIGSLGDDALGDGSGAIYAYEANGSSWEYHGKRVASDGTEEDIFGKSVAILPGPVFAGAPQDSPQGLFSGSAYVYEWDDLESFPAMTLYFEFVGYTVGRIWWDGISGAQEYRLYRFTSPFYQFDADTENPWYVVGANSTEVTFSAGIGDPDVNYYFVGVAAAPGQSSPKSNVVGEFDFDVDVP